MSRFFLCITLFIFATLHAEPNDTIFTSIEILYFKPTIDQPYFAISSSDNTFQVPPNDPEFFPNGTRFNNDPLFSPGFRLEGIYALCDAIAAFDFRFTYFNKGHTNSVSGPFLFDTIGFPGSGAQRPEDTSYNGTARYTEHFRYVALDATFNRFTMGCCPENLTFLLGLHFASIRFNEIASSDGFDIEDVDEEPTMVTVLNRFTRNSHFWGLGPQFGFDYFYYFPQFSCEGLFGLRTNARLSLLVSHTWADLHYRSSRTGPVGVNLDNEPAWRINPCADVKVGFTYDRTICCLDMSFELGYELIWYSDAIDAITGYDPAFAGDTIDLYSSLHLQGPYLAIGACF